MLYTIYSSSPAPAPTPFYSPSGGFQGANNFGQNYGALTWAAPINIVQRPQIIAYGASPFILTSDGVHGNITGYRSSYPAPTLTTSTSSLFYNNFPQTVSCVHQPTYTQPTHAQPVTYAQPTVTYSQPATTYVQPALSYAQPTHAQPTYTKPATTYGIMPSPYDNNWKNIESNGVGQITWSGRDGNMYSGEVIPRQQPSFSNQSTPHKKVKIMIQPPQELEQPQQIKTELEIKSKYIAPFDPSYTRQLMASVNESLSRGSAMRLRVIHAIGPGRKIFASSLDIPPSPPTSSSSLYSSSLDIPPSPPTSSSLYSPSPQPQSSPPIYSSPPLLYASPSPTPTLPPFDYENACNLPIKDLKSALNSRLKILTEYSKENKDNQYGHNEPLPPPSTSSPQASSHPAYNARRKLLEGWETAIM